MNAQQQPDPILPKLEEDGQVSNSSTTNSAVSPLSSHHSQSVQDPQKADSGLSAEDVDLIEKEWVEKAKRIVNNTQGDPYTQNEELSKMKSEYLKKRYNKDIKPGS